LDEIEKDYIFFDTSGGEPLIQVDFLTRMHASCPARRIHTVVDTSGYASPV
jgi:pyruvate formate lyase activating enzyme